MMEKRIYNLDNVKVILMLLVIIGHTLLNSYGDDSIEYIRFICRCFTMPLFTFISGYLTKKEQAFWKNVKYLLYPCLLFTVVNDILQILVTPNYVFSWKQPGFAMWYLLALFIYRVLLPYLLRIKYVLLLSFLLSWLVGFIPFIGNDYSLSRIFCFLPYFLLGYFVAHENRFSIIKDAIFTKLNWRGYLVFIVLFLFWAFVIERYPGVTYATGFTNGFGLSIKGLFVRIALQVTIVITGFCVMKICPNKETFYTKYGSNTMNVYLLHALVVLPFIYLVFPSFGEATLFEKIALIIVPTICCLPLFSNIINQLMKIILCQGKVHREKIADL